MTEWVSRTYTYSEPRDDTLARDDHSGIDGPDNLPLRGAGNRPDYDSGFDVGYRVGWVAGYEAGRNSDIITQRTIEDKDA